MATLKVYPDRILGRIKPLHAGGQLTVSSSGQSDFHLFSDIGVPYSRLHDVGGAFGGNKYVDVPNIFRDFSADPNDPASYDFTFTDRLLEDLVKAGIEPYFRLGVTIENAAAVKPYRIFPPADYDKWACVCEHIVAHYLEGWADGYRYKITYWEIWNEPENCGPYSEYKKNQMWTGTAEDYYRLYDVTAKRLKKRFPQIRVGGYGSCGFYLLTANPEHEEPTATKWRQYYVDFFRGFLKYVKEHGSPIDFFSWHSYADVRATLKHAAFVQDELIKTGFGGLPTHINEWNPCHDERGTARHGAEVAAMMLAMQNQPVVSLMCLYDMRAYGSYAPLFDSMRDRPTYAYYALAAFNRLYELGEQIEVSCDDPGLYAVAASDGTHYALMIANPGWEKRRIRIEGDGIDLYDARYYIMDDGRLLSWAHDVDVLNPNSVALIEF